MLAAPAAPPAGRVRAAPPRGPHAGDLSTATAPLLENGVPGNRQGGLGSGLAYAGGNIFLALPDRGPNANPYDSSVDDTVNYIPRFQTLKLDLALAEVGSALPYELSIHLVGTTLLGKNGPLVYGAGGAPALNDPQVSYFTGRSDAFDPAVRSSRGSVHGRLDPEGIRVSNNGHTVFITDEYGPFVYAFNRCTGRLKRSYSLPSMFGVWAKGSKGDDEIANNTVGRVANKGMEGLAISPDGTALFGAMQSPLLQDGGTSAAVIRIAKIDLATGAILGQYAYRLDNIGTAAKPKYPTISEVIAINDHELLLDERDGKGLGDDSAAVTKKLYHIDLTGAEDVSAVVGEANLIPKAVAKDLFLDLAAALNGAGMDTIDIPAKLEGVAFGPDIEVNGVTKHSLFVSNDNDYLARFVDSGHPDGAENPNRIFVFAVDGADLPGYTPQLIAPAICK
jgi:outer membrane protein assembly factor BamB